LKCRKSIPSEKIVSDHCCAPAPPDPKDGRYQRILWIALAVNSAMFAIEIGGAWKSGSASLLADAVDFAGDAANYGLSLAVLSIGLLWRSRVALIKGISMGLYGLLVLARVVYGIRSGLPPEPAVMGGIGVLALLANLSVAALLYAYRTGDANMRSVWLCTRNDAIGNVAVMAAAAGVLLTGSAWPDLIVAVMMATLGLVAAFSVVAQARAELASVSNIRRTPS
jgi:Co/Zn/Cd efflux system component